jgi:hypothetical protein
LFKKPLQSSTGALSKGKKLMNVCSTSIEALLISCKWLFVQRTQKKANLGNHHIPSIYAPKSVQDSDHQEQRMLAQGGRWTKRREHANSPKG